MLLRAFQVHVNMSTRLQVRHYIERKALRFFSKQLLLHRFLPGVFFLDCCCNDGLHLVYVRALCLQGLQMLLPRRCCCCWRLCSQSSRLRPSGCEARMLFHSVQRFNGLHSENQLTARGCHSLLLLHLHSFIHGLLNVA